jgi:2-oxoglutarate dehydrogenase E2 component (dihydrolipoamide succinyltransferase)
MTSSVEVRAPAEQSEGTRSQIQRWLKSVGDPVVQDEPLIEVETDKVTIEIPSPAEGVLQEILKQEQEEIAPGELLARIEVRAAESAVTPTGAEVTPQSPAPAGEDIVTAALSAHAAALAGRSSPAVRRLLAEHGVHPSQVRGTGGGGRITVDDVLRYVSRRAERESAPQAPAQAQTGGVSVPIRSVAHTPTRKRIAERMVESLLHTAPHVTTVFEVDLSAVLAHRQSRREQFASEGVPLTLTAYFVAACVDAIREVPEANSRWTDDALEIFETIDIGVGTAVEDKGLLVPVVRAVQSLDLKQIARALADLTTRARDGRLAPADVRGGTFTISNHGVSGSLLATPIIINQPQSAILGVGKLEKRAVVVTEAGEDRIVVRPRCYVTLTLDHRVMDGQRANRFLEVFVERLENWRD